MSTAVKVSVSIPQTFSGEIDPAYVKTFAQRAEALGFDGLWVQESIVGRARQLDSIELLTFVAAVTSRVRLGTAVLLTPLRPPVPLAKTLVTLDQLSAGRLTVGLGLGRPGPANLAFGVEPASSVARFLEAFKIMKALWTEDSVTYEGKFWQLRDVAMEPKPAQKPHPPVWFGVHAPAALKRTVRYADGFIGAGGTSTAQFRDEAIELRRLLTEAGRDPATFPLSKRVYIAVDEDKARAGQRLGERLGGAYGGNAGGQPTHERVAVFGPPAECVDKLMEVVQAGAGMVLLTPLFDEAEQLEIFASDIKPHLERANA
ncbi:MAG: LLM class flavin-dependent oxidoreductase [Chloroflexi bacterium]|nr:LLM class flavin-dependent oxidoreductase [Chloroflexota bacterium]